MRLRDTSLVAIVALGMVCCDSPESRARTVLDHFVRAKAEAKAASLASLPENERANFVQTFESEYQNTMVRLNTSGKGDTLSKAVLDAFAADIRASQGAVEHASWNAKTIKEAFETNRATMAEYHMQGNAQLQNLVAAQEKAIPIAEKSLALSQKVLEIYVAHQSEVMKILSKS